MSIYPKKWGATLEQERQLKTQALEAIRKRGGDITPMPPRSLVAQSASRSILVTWNSDPNQHPCVEWRVYKDTESQLYRQLPHGMRQCEVTSSAGSTPPIINVFVSAYNPFNGKESRKVLVSGAAAAESAGSAPPSIPSPPPQWTKEPTGGSGKNKNLQDREYSGRGRFTE